MSTFTVPTATFPKAVIGPNWCQISFETGDKTIRKFANRFRKLGFTVSTSSLGLQFVYGSAYKVTMISIRNLTTLNDFDKVVELLDQFSISYRS